MKQERGNAQRGITLAPSSARWRTTCISGAVVCLGKVGKVIGVGLGNDVLHNMQALAS